MERWGVMDVDVRTFVFCDLTCLSCLLTLMLGSGTDQGPKLYGELMMKRRLGSYDRAAIQMNVVV